MCVCVKVCWYGNTVKLGATLCVSRQGVCDGS